MKNMNESENNVQPVQQSEQKQEPRGKLKAFTKWSLPLISIAVILVVGLTTILSFGRAVFSASSLVIAEDRNVFSLIFTLASTISGTDMSGQYAYIKLLIAFVYIAAIVAAIAPIILIVMGMCFLPSAIKKNDTKILERLAVLTVAISAACQVLLILSQLIMSGGYGVSFVVAGVTGAIGGLIAGVVLLVIQSVIKFIAKDKNDRMPLNDFIKCAITFVFAVITLFVILGGSSFSTLFDSFAYLSDKSDESILTTCYAMVFVQYFVMIGYVAIVLAVIISTLNSMLKGERKGITTMFSIVAILSSLSLIISIVIPIMLSIKYGSDISVSLSSLKIILIAFPAIELALSLLTHIIPRVVLNGKSNDSVK